MGRGQAIITLGEVSIKRSYNGILAGRIIYMTCPLADTGSAGVGQHHTADFIESAQVPVFFNGITDQFGAWCHRKLTSCF